MGLYWLLLGWLAPLLRAAMLLLLLLLQGRQQGGQVGLLTKHACCSKPCIRGCEVSQSACRLTAAVWSVAACWRTQMSCGTWCTVYRHAP